MLYFDENAYNDILSQQIAINKNRIKSINDLIKNKKELFFPDDYKLFCSLQNIMFDKRRKYKTYDIQETVTESKLTLNEIQKNYGNFKTYCDIGCGRGYFSRAAFELGCEYSVGIDSDASQQSIWNTYREKTDGRLNYICRDISASYPPPSHTTTITTRSNSHPI